MFARPVTAKAPPRRPLPAQLATGSYTCFASVPHYTGSTYMKGVGSMPQYRFTWERVGTLSLNGSTYRSGSGASAPYRYDPATGKVVWGGGMHATIESNFAYTKDGKPEIHRKDGKRGTWHCQP